MKVLFDYQIFTMQKYGGISRYYVELMKEYKKAGEEFTLSTLLSNNAYIKEVKDIYTYKDTRIYNKIAQILNRFVSRREIKKSSFDLFHPTYYDPYFLTSIRKPYVLTMYDFIHEKFSDMYPEDDKTVVWKKEAALNASRIIAISENTKKDIMKYYNIEDNKIDIVYLASSLQKTDKIPDEFIPKEYILFVGNRSLYKNFKRFIKAVSPLLKNSKELHLICAGGGIFTSEESDMLFSLGIKEKVLFINIDDDILAFLYQNAKMFVFPSTYEGFGIPILEAFNCDCPTVLSNTSSLPEVGGNAAEYFDPYSEESIYTAINALLDNPDRQKELVALGKIQREKFSWEKTARSTIKIYKKSL